MKYNIDYEDIDQVITILQRNGWKTSLVSTGEIEDYPIIKAEHEGVDKKILLLTVGQELFSNLQEGSDLFEKFKSINSDLKNFTKYLSCLQNNSGSKEMILKEVS